MENLFVRRSWSTNNLLKLGNMSNVATVWTSGTMDWSRLLTQSRFISLFSIKSRFWALLESRLSFLKEVANL